MAFTASSPTNEPRSFSIGPLKVQLFNIGAASGDTSGTITASGLSSIDFCLVTGLVQSAAPTFSANVATLAFVDPAATVKGQVLVFGR
jgi:hypothetical protein